MMMVVVVVVVVVVPVVIMVALVICRNSRWRERADHERQTYGATYEKPLHRFLLGCNSDHAWERPHAVTP